MTFMPMEVIRIERMTNDERGADVEMGLLADLEIPDTADLEVGATGRFASSSPTRDYWPAATGAAAAAATGSGGAGASFAPCCTAQR